MGLCFSNLNTFDSVSNTILFKAEKRIVNKSQEELKLPVGSGASVPADTLFVKFQETPFSIPASLRLQPPVGL